MRTDDCPRPAWTGRRPFLEDLIICQHSGDKVSVYLVYVEIRPEDASL